MGTAWSEIVCNYAMPIIDDVRLTDEMGTNQALFLRRMSIYVTLALPNLSRPPELDAYLKYDLTEPDYADTAWITTEDSTEGNTDVDTGYAGYDLFSCSLRTVDSAGIVTLTPYPDAVYDVETGIVSFPVQNASGLEYIMDFYTDGSFGNELTEAQKRLVGMAMAIVWDERFSRSWLNIQQKVKDSSFDTVNESNYMREVQSRLVTNRGLLNDELRKYEQDLAYSNTVLPRHGLRYV